MLDGLQTATVETKLKQFCNGQIDAAMGENALIYIYVSVVSRYIYIGYVAIGRARPHRRVRMTAYYPKIFVTRNSGQISSRSALHSSGPSGIVHRARNGYQEGVRKMDADETSGATTAWTPGPWEFDGPDEYSDCRVYHSRGGDDRDREPIWGDTNEANGRLIALAPEMAAAVMEYARVYSLPRSKLLAAATSSGDNLLALADKLRAIGGDR